MNIGKFIVFEGLDASGKDTQAELLAQYLRRQERGRQTVVLNAPCGGPCHLGIILRKMLSGKPWNELLLEKMGPEATQKLFTAEKIEHYFSHIVPLLHAGTDVVQVRWHCSMAVYGAPLEVPHLLAIQQKMLDRLVRFPDVTIFLEVSAEEAWRRLLERDRGNQSIYEKREKLDDHVKRYQEVLDHFMWNEPIIAPGERSREEIHRFIVQKLERRWIEREARRTRND